jgi:hypothetical protein
MLKRKTTDQVDHPVKRNYTSQDFVYYLPASKTQKITEVSPTKIGK